jgi:CDP-diglyceride synthetase
MNVSRVLIATTLLTTFYLNYFFFLWIGIWFTSLASMEIAHHYRNGYKKLTWLETGLILSLFLCNTTLLALCVDCVTVCHFRLHNIFPQYIVKVSIINSGSDILQYIGGKIFGKGHPFPDISPNKTTEGYLFGVILGTLLGSVIQNCGYIESLIYIILGIIGGLISSFIKRKMCLKDWSSLLGSHGGYADRTDSITIAVLLAPLLLNTELSK